MKNAMVADHRFDLSANLSALMGANAFVGFEVDANPLPVKIARRG